MTKLTCPACGSEAFDEPCEHTVYVAANECGLIYVAEEYREHLFAVAERLLRKQGELEKDESLSMDYFLCEIIPELADYLEIENIVYKEEYAIPPSGLAVYAAFIDQP